MKYYEEEKSQSKRRSGLVKSISGTLVLDSLWPPGPDAPESCWSSGPGRPCRGFHAGRCRPRLCTPLSLGLCPRRSERLPRSLPGKLRTYHTSLWRFSFDSSQEMLDYNTRHKYTNKHEYVIPFYLMLGWLDKSFLQQGQIGWKLQKGEIKTSEHKKDCLYWPQHPCMWGVCCDVAIYL